MALLGLLSACNRGSTAADQQDGASASNVAAKGDACQEQAAKLEPYLSQRLTEALKAKIAGEA
jgi:hypothetical protein